MSRVALITGGGRGIGRGISLGLAEDGFDVALTYRKGAEAAEETVDEIHKLGQRAIALQGDVSRQEDNERVVAEVLAEFGELHALVSNGGIASRGRSVAETEADELQRVMATHAMGPHHLCSVAIPHMRKHDRADVVVVSSVATLGYAANGAPYSMGKAAGEALAYSLAKEERSNGIHVNVVAPGLVDTEMGRRLVKGAAGIDDIRTLDDSMPWGRVCTPEDIANAVRFFLSEKASYVTGEKLNVWGGGQEWR